MDLPINYLALLACSVAAMVLGSLWYGPFFGKAWMAIIGMKKPEVMTAAIKNSMMRSYALVFVSSFVMAYVLAHVLAFSMAFTGMTGITAGLQAGFWSWLGFVVPVSLGPTLWEGRPWKYWCITAGYYLVILCIMGVILALWR